MRAAPLTAAFALVLATGSWVEPSVADAAPPAASAPPPSAAPPPAAAPPSSPPPSAGRTAPPPSAAPPPPPSAASAPATDKPAVEIEEDRPPVDLSDTWSYSHAGAPVPRYVRRVDDPEAVPNPEGYYSGVSIEGNHVPPFPARSIGTKPASLTWTGFERADGHSRVFFELSADVATKLEIRGGVVSLRMTNTKINVRNNARHLDLRYFRTPVRTVKVSRKGKDAVATITLKRAAEPTIAWMKGKAGYRLLVLDFADGTDADDEDAR
ncbi:MAG: hypothetical protein K1X88_33455 [Nannocystaceae bacterium]|nr:hypothetical protein [Nannocystaceae bacterium]